METKIQFGGAGRDYKLTSAILIYSDLQNRNPDGSSAQEHFAATVHDVEHVGRGQPIIKPGQPVSIAALEHLMLSLGRSHAAGFIPENILSVGLDRMAWWCPAGRRRLWFKTYRNDEGHKELKALNGKLVHHPPLLFVVKGGLNVYALLRNARPKPDTAVYRAPYWNLGNGHMCNGDIKLPPCQPENIMGFDAAFFNSAFTHGRGEGLTHHKGGHTGLWTYLSKRKSRPDTEFWRTNLIRTRQTINAVLK